jgi:hypothetical protein
MILMLAGCSSQSESLLGGSTKNQLATPAGSASSKDSATILYDYDSSNQAAALPKKMSNQWTFKLEVQDSRQANAGINAQAEQLQGYLVESHINTIQDQVEANLIVKVPANRAQAMVDYLEKLGYVEEEAKTSLDVSDTYYDTEARLKVLIAEEERLLTFIQNKTANIQDMLALEKEIARVRQDRESLQARMNLLNNQVDYTSFTIKLTENQTGLQAPKGTMGKAGQGFVSSLGLLVKFINGFFIALITLLPFLIVLGGLFYTFRRWQRGRKARKARMLQETAPIYAPGVQPPDDKSNDKPER